MSVLMVSTEYPPMPGGVGRYTRNLSHSLKRFGVEMYVICNKKGDGDFSGLDASNEENSDLLLRIVSELRPDIVHVQLEHGLYGLNFAEISRFRMRTNIDEFYEKCQVPIITTFHSAYPLKQWISLSPSHPFMNANLSDIPIEASRRLLKYWNRIFTYKLFNKANREKMFRSAASVAFSEYMANILSTGTHKVSVIYHGAEPNLMIQPSKESARSKYSLPVDKKIALALGFATHTKGWDILREMKIPDNWTILVNHSRNYYSQERDLADPLDKRDNQGNKAGDDHNNNRNKKLFELNLGFIPDDALSLLFYASDTVIMPYSVASGSGVMFDALAHGLPFVASDLGFFKEFAGKGLGLAVRRKADEFSKALKFLEANYPSYKREVDRFKNDLIWDSVARQHVALYMSVLASRKKEWRPTPTAVRRKNP
jgi:glycosyltransferase involved in cell wall biosynthesis